MNDTRCTLLFSYLCFSVCENIVCVKVRYYCLTTTAAV